jgi:hypothetical protein
MVRQSSRSTAKLKAIGREYMKATGGGYSDADLEQMNLPDGTRWKRSDAGALLVEIDNYGTMTAQAAMRQGVLRE